MNFIEGTLRRAGGGASLEMGKGAPIRLPDAAPGRDGQKVIFGIRPEHLALADGGADVLAGEIIVVEPTGAETQVMTNVGGTQIAAMFTERHEFAPGAKIALRPRAETIHLFDAETGRHL
jgi:multiple sugar transport system ATP-binding protein